MKTIKFVLSDRDLSILKAALKAYPYQTGITQVLLKIIEVQVEEQSDKE